MVSIYNITSFGLFLTKRAIFFNLFDFYFSLFTSLQTQGQEKVLRGLIINFCKNVSHGIAFDFEYYKF